MGEEEFKCNICGKETRISEGIHLDDGANFCGVPHLCQYTENMQNSLKRLISSHQGRIEKLEEKYRNLKKDLALKEE